MLIESRPGLEYPTIVTGSTNKPQNEDTQRIPEFSRCLKETARTDTQSVLLRVILKDWDELRL